MRSMDECSIVVEDNAAELAVRVVGELDLCSGELLKDAIRSCGDRSIVVDLERVSFMDVAGHRALTAALDHPGTDVRVERCAPAVVRIVELLRELAERRGARPSA